MRDVVSLDHLDSGDSCTPVGELAARTFREFYMSESVLERSDFVPGSRRGVRKSHRRILRRTFGHSPRSPGPTRTPDSGLSRPVEVVTVTLLYDETLPEYLIRILYRTRKYVVGCSRRESDQKYSTSSYNRDGDFSATGAAHAVMSCCDGEHEAAPSGTDTPLAAIDGTAATPVAG